MNSSISNKKKCIFLDRDGVIINDKGLLLNLGNIQYRNGVKEFLFTMKEKNWSFVLISNQAIVSRGIITYGEMQELNEFILDGLGVSFLDVKICIHHPMANRIEFRRKCRCRKPSPGMILEAAREHDIDLARSFMIGDRCTDYLAARRAGCEGILINSSNEEENFSMTSSSRGYRKRNFTMLDNFSSIEKYIYARELA